MSRSVLGHTLLIMSVAAVAGCGDDVRIPLGASDPTPPSQVIDLAVAVEEDTVIVLTWSAPSDVGLLGAAAAYDVRYSTSLISDATWDAATLAGGEPRPGEPGSSERFAVPGLRPNASYYFALKALDLKANDSELSNVVLLDVDPPFAIEDLTAVGATSRTISLTWTAPSDNGYLGRAVSYDLRLAAEMISEHNWNSAMPVSGAPEPGPAGSTEDFVVTGLEPLTLYYLGIRSRDGDGNLSPLSNVVEVMTTTAPQGWWDGFSIYGPNNEVYSLLPLGSDLIVGGTFTAAGSVPASRVASWSGSGWSGLGSGFDKGPGTTTVRVLGSHAGDLIAGGVFGLSGTAQVRNVAKWDAPSWMPLGLGTDGMVRALCTYDGDLYIGGLFFTVGGHDINAIARWDGSSWHGMDWDYSYSSGVTSLLVHDGELIAAGAFSRAAEVAAENIAAWNGSSWRPLGEGFGGGVSVTVVGALCVYNGDLIAAGNFQSSGATTVNHIARWDGVSWSPLGDGIGDDPANDYIGGMVVYNGDLIVGGRFKVAGSQSVKNIARWDGASWSTLDGGLTGQDPYTGVQALAVYDGSLYVGGRFEFAGEVQSLNMARWDD